MSTPENIANYFTQMAVSVKKYVSGELGDLYFTGLQDTPAEYKAYSDKFFVVPSGNQLAYDTVRFLENVSDAPEHQLVDGYLKLVQQNGNLVLQWSAGTTDSEVNYSIDGATHFTGLLDTPTGYKHGHYVRVKEGQNKLEYISSTGLAQDTAHEMVHAIVTGKLLDFTGLADTPTGYKAYTDKFFVVPSGDQLAYDTVRFLENVSDAPDTLLNNGFLKLTREDFDAPWELEWSDVEDNDTKHFTGLLDTPTGYNSGYYLMSNETGIEYQSLTGLADRLIDYGFRTGAAFTGLQDTPPNYALGEYLESTHNGLKYVNAHDLATTLGSIPKKYQEGVNFEGHLVNSGCDLYLVCNGQWIKYYSYNGILKSDSSDIPACVNTVEELALYEQYKDYTTSEYGTNLFDEELNGPNPSTDFHNVCLFSTDSNSKVSIDETTYKWGIFNGDQTINLTALPGNGAGFSHWTGYGATFGDPNNRNTTTFIDKDLSITGVFNATPSFDFSNYSATNSERILTSDAANGDHFGTAVALDGDMLVVTTYEQTESENKGGALINNDPFWSYFYWQGDRVGDTIMRQHMYTFIYNHNTQLWDQVGKQELTKTYANYQGSSYNHTAVWNQEQIHTMKLVGDTLFCGMPAHNQLISPDIRQYHSSSYGTDTGSIWETPKCGAVKIFKWSNGTWVEVQMLQQPISGVLNPNGVQYSWPSDAGEAIQHLEQSGFGSGLDIRGDKLLVSTNRWPRNRYIERIGRILVYTKSTNGDWELTDTIYRPIDTVNYPDTDVASMMQDDTFGMPACFGAHKNQIIAFSEYGGAIFVLEKQNDGTWLVVKRQDVITTVPTRLYATPPPYQELFFIDGNLYTHFNNQMLSLFAQIDTSDPTNWVINWDDNFTSTQNPHITLPHNNTQDHQYFNVRKLAISGNIIASSAILDDNIYNGAGTVYINRL